MNLEINCFWRFISEFEYSELGIENSCDEGRFVNNWTRAWDKIFSPDLPQVRCVSWEAT